MGHDSLVGVVGVGSVRATPHGRCVPVVARVRIILPIVEHYLSDREPELMALSQPCPP